MAFSPSEAAANDTTPPTEVEELEDTLKDCGLSPPAPELSADGSDADVISRGSSTVYYEQEAFETYQHKVAQLCHDIGYGTPAKIERMKGGGYNRVIGLTLENGQKRDYVLRIPREAADEVEMDKIKDQVAVTLYLSRFDFLHVPKVAAFDTTINNVLKCQYVLQERVEGFAVHRVFYTVPLAEKLQIATAVAEKLLQLESIKLEGPGRLVGTGDLPDRSDLPPKAAQGIKVTGFANDPVEDLPVMDKQPLASLICSLLEIRKQRNIEWDEMVERCERLQAIAKEMEVLGLMSNMDQDCVPWHWDLSSANVMINQVIITPVEVLAQGKPNDKTSTCTTKDGSVSTEEATAVKHLSSPIFSLPDTGLTSKWVVSGVLDWDDAMSVPLVLARKPPFWLWLDYDTHGSIREGERRVIELTGDELVIKAQFDQTMAQSNPSYIDDAYHRGPLIRELASFAIYNFEDGVNYDRYDGFVEEWEKVRKTLT